MSDSLFAQDYDKKPELTALEAKTLKQYQELAVSLVLLKEEIKSTVIQLDQQNLENAIATGQQDLNTAPPMYILVEQLRSLEEKFGLVSTSFKNSVYRVLVNTGGATNDDGIGGDGVGVTDVEGEDSEVVDVAAVVKSVAAAQGLNDLTSTMDD